MKIISGSAKKQVCVEKLEQYNIASGLDGQFAGLFTRLAVGIAESGLGYMPDTNMVVSRTDVSGNGIYAAKTDIKANANGDIFEWRVEDE